LSIIKIGGPNLRPHLSTLIGTLLESMSNLEPTVFSYLQFHAQSMQMTEEQLERARLSLASGGVLADAVASCLLVVDEESVPGIIAKLTDIIHTGIGLPTLTAAAKFVVSLAGSKVAPAMRDHIAPLITQLMQGLSDSSPTLRKVYADALGYLCKIAKVRIETSTHTCSRTQSTHNLICFALFVFALLIRRKNALRSC
jgi:proteasome component ECM29